MFFRVWLRLLRTHLQQMAKQVMRQSLIRQEISEDTDVEITILIYKVIKLDCQNSKHTLGSQ